MPTYGYRCESCGTEFDVWQRMTDEAGAACTACGEPARRQFFPAGIVFKGGGFYKTDSRAASKPSSAGKEAAASSSAGKDAAASSSGGKDAAASGSDGKDAAASGSGGSGKAAEKATASDGGSKSGPGSGASGGAAAATSKE